jgi:hypothetical protein
VAALVVGGLSSVPAWGASLADGIEVRLPTIRDAFLVDPSIDVILNGPKALETRLPGRVEDTEHVRIAMDLDGTPVEVAVEQRLVVHGLGDFSFRVPGPAIDVEALPGSESEPGLRRGAILWQGFSPGRKELGARMQLYPEQEVQRLPIEVELEMSVDGEPVDPDEPVNGPFELTIRVANRTGVPIPVADADADPGLLAPAMDAIFRSLQDGLRPEPGHDAVPQAVAVNPPLGTVDTVLESPLLVEASLGFEPGSVEGLEVSSDSDASMIRSDDSLSWTEQLGGGGPLEQTVTVTGTATDMELPSLRIGATTALPEASLMEPPGPGTWTEAAAEGRATDGRAMLRSAMETMWMTARTRQYDAYVGNPDRAGPAITEYEFVLDPPEEQAAPPPVAAGGVEPVGAVAMALGALGLAWLGLVAWSRS